MGLLAVEGLSKSYPGVKAADGISFALEPGEIHALLGENGAGKSTLVKMIYGVVRPDSGQMLLNGKPFQPRGPAEARAAGIGMVFQHFSLFEAMSVEENVALGLSAEAARGDLAQRIVDVSKSYGLDIAPKRMVGELSVGERQRIEIVRCLLQNPRLLIMDEPTSVLTPREANDLFRTLKQLASEGRSVLYISHKLEEIRSLCDRATVLRGGRVVGAAVPRNESARALAELMIGTSLKSPERSAVKAGPVRLKVSGLSVAADGAFGTALKDISFEVRGGEILGIAGVAGNGQTELMEALIGEVAAPTMDAIVVDGAYVGDAGPTARRARRMAFVPEERLGHGAVPGMSLTENMVLSSRGAVSAAGMIDWGAAEQMAAGIVRQFDVRTAGVDRAARSLSGGNLQKFVVGREMALNPVVFIASQPTWGVDAGAAAEIHKAILTLAQEGAAVVLISQDLDELFQVASHLAVIAGGRLTAARPIEAVTIADIGMAMEGQRAAGEELGAARHA
ncbi:MAG: ABC transporter ATP-binding protein [Hyphomicrobiaceae bacterium]